MLKKRIFGILVVLMAVMLVFTLVGCGDSSDSAAGDPQTITYTGYNGTIQYNLEITENMNRAAYAPQSGDNFKLIEVISTNTMSGTIEISDSGTTITLIPNNGSGSITVTVSGDGIVSINGTNLKWDDGSVFTAPGTLTPNSGSSAYAFPCMSGPLASYWNYNAGGIYMWLNTPGGSDWVVTFDDTAFREKTKEDELDLGGFPAGFNGGFTVTINGEEVLVLDSINVNNGDIRIYFDHTGTKATDVIRVKYDKPALEKWHIPYDDTGVNPLKGVLESFGYTAPIMYVD